MKMKRVSTAVAAFVIGVVAAGCQKGASTPTVPDVPQPEFDAAGSPTSSSWNHRDSFPWTNGRIGFRIGPWGLGADIEGQPLPAWRVDSYDPQGEQKLLPLPTPLPTAWQLDSDPAWLRKAKITRYSQTQQGSTLTTTIEGSHPVARTFSLRTSLSITTAEPGRIVLEWNFKSDSSASFTIGALPTRWHGNVINSSPPQSRSGRWTLTGPDTPRQTVWQPRITLEGPPEDQQALRMLEYWTQAMVPTPVRPGETVPVSPFGLTNDRYFGHVFWDADVWVFPALALLYPDLAKQIPEYRLSKFDQAQRNAKLAAENPEIPFGDRSTAARGAMYPWESSVDGRETVPGPSRQQHHITGTVAFALQKAAWLGLVPQDKVDRVGIAAADFWWGRSKPGPKGRVVERVMSPDEFHIGDNDLYTNAIAEWTVNRFAPERRAKFFLPRDNVTFLTYDRDTLKSYKQAAALLGVYPLQNPLIEADAAEMLDRFQGKSVKNGPAMTLSIEALIAARLGRSDQAYAWWQESWKKYTQNRWMLFSESPKNADRTVFLTGTAGCLQTVLYGFLGLRIDTKAQQGSRYVWPLTGGAVLSMRPNLPKGWNRVVVDPLVVRGQGYRVEVTPTEVRVSKRPQPPAKP
jgi:hypothetical protein